MAIWIADNLCVIWLPGKYYEPGILIMDHPNNWTSNGPLLRCSIIRSPLNPILGSPLSHGFVKKNLTFIKKRICFYSKTYFWLKLNDVAVLSTNQVWVNSFIISRDNNLYQNTKNVL